MDKHFEVGDLISSDYHSLTGIILDISKKGYLVCDGRNHMICSIDEIERFDNNSKEKERIENSCLRCENESKRVSTKNWELSDAGHEIKEIDGDNVEVDSRCGDVIAVPNKKYLIDAKTLHKILRSNVASDEQEHYNNIFGELAKYSTDKVTKFSGKK